MVLERLEGEPVNALKADRIMFGCGLPFVEGGEEVLILRVDVDATQFVFILPDGIRPEGLIDSLRMAIEQCGQRTWKNVTPPGAQLN